MMLSIPPALHRLALRIAQPVRLRWWRLARVQTHGCRVVVENAQGAVLLIRHTYHQPDVWMLPGGGLGRQEDVLTAAAREVREEAGCRLEGAVSFGEAAESDGGWTNRVSLVAGMTSDTPAADGREIAEARFFAPDALPGTTSNAARHRIALWLASSARGRRGGVGE